MTQLSCMNSLCINLGIVGSFLAMICPAWAEPNESPIRHELRALANGPVIKDWQKHVVRNNEAERFAQVHCRSDWKP